MARKHKTYRGYIMSMVWVGIGSAVIGAGASIYSANKASDATEDATNAALDSEWRMFQQQREDYAPWREAGEEGLAEYRREILDPASTKFDPSTEPGYRFGFEEFIEKPYIQGEGAKGKRLSGESAKGLTRYAMDYGSTKYDNFLNRYGQLANYGVGAAAGSADAAGQYGNNAANLQYGNAMAQGNYQTQMAAGIGGAVQGGMQNWMDYQMMQKMGVA